MRIKTLVVFLLLFLTYTEFTIVYATNAVISSKSKLADADSPYLRLHADNPVNWYPWGKEAFNEAKKENKLIFLSIGYSTCYWCHVMEGESFSDPKVAAIMNRYYINIKVDREQRPDVDEVYLTALQLMNGEAGWPISIFLTPDLKPFYGATYIPMPEFIELLKNIYAAWEGENKNRILEGADQIATALKRATYPRQTTQEKTLPSAEMMQNVISHYQKLFDSTYGGFNSQPKFPQFPILELLITDYHYRKNPDSLIMLTTTLDAIFQGGIHDQIGGGLHRYTIDRQWGIPHFEKMLYSQAQALMVYTKAYQITKNESYLYMAMRIVDYLKDKLLSPDGLFYSAEDAQTNQKEGQTYIWSKEELQKVLSPQEFNFVSKSYNLNEKSWGENRHKNQGIILNFKTNPTELAKKQNLSLKAFYQKLKDINQKLLKRRQQRAQPNLDTKIITSWNGLTISALAYAGQVLNDKNSLQMAKHAGTTLWQKLHTKKVPLYHMIWRNNAQIPAYLDDYAATILAFNHLYEVTQDKTWLSKAKIIADAMIQQLWSSYSNFYYVNPSTEDLISHQQLSFDGANPSGNSLAVEALIKLSNSSGDSKYAQYAEKVLKTYSLELKDNPLTLPYMAITLYDFEKYLNKSKQAQSPSNLHSKNFVTMKAQLSDKKLGLNQKITIDLTLTIKKGWHINANPASLDFLIPTTVQASLDKGIVKLKLDYPKGKKVNFATGEKIQVYVGNLNLPVNLILTKVDKKDSKSAILTISVKVQACNDKGRCLLPSDLIQTFSMHYDQK